MRPTFLKRLARVGVILLVNLLVFLALFAVVEAGYRLYRDGFPGAFVNAARSFGAPYSNLGTSNWVVYDARLGYRLNPGREGINSRSVRHGEIVVPKPPGLFRIIFLGDSIPWARPGFVGYTREALGERGNVEVINAAVPGYTSYQEALFYRTQLAVTEADLVVWTYCLNDNHRFLHRFNEKGGLLWTREAEESLRINSRWDKIASRSYLLSLLRLGFAARARKADASRGSFEWETLPDFNIAWKDYSWEDHERQMKALLESARGTGTRCAVVIFPYEPQLLHRADADRRRYILKPQRKLRALCRKRGIPCLDLYPSFSAEYDRGRRFFRDRIHLNTEGHRFTTREIISFLDGQGLLPSPFSQDTRGGEAQGRTSAASDVPPVEGVEDRR